MSLAPPTAPKVMDAATIEYINNLKLLLEEDCFVLKKPTGCFSLAQLMMSMLKDVDNGKALLESTCTKMKHSESCYNLAMAIAPEPGMEVKTTDLFLKGCEYGHGASCNNAGLLIEGGAKGKTIDWKYLEELYTRGCDQLLSPASCHSLSNLYRTGGVSSKSSSSATASGNTNANTTTNANTNNITSGSLKNTEKALHYAEKGCDLGFPYACVNASRMYSLGDGVEKNDAKAQYYKELAETTFANLPASLRSKKPPSK